MINEVEGKFTVVCDACAKIQQQTVVAHAPETCHSLRDATTYFREVGWKIRRYHPDWCPKCVNEVQQKLDAQGAKGIDGVSPQRVRDELTSRE